MFVCFSIIPRGLVVHRQNVIDDTKKVIGGGKNYLTTPSVSSSPSTSPGHTNARSQVTRTASMGTQSPTKTPGSPRARRTAPPPPTHTGGTGEGGQGTSRSTRPVSMWAGTEYPDYTKHNGRRSAPEPPQRRGSESISSAAATQQWNQDFGHRSPSGSTGSLSGNRTLSQERLPTRSRSSAISYPDRTTRTVITSSEVATENGGVSLSSFSTFLPQPSKPQTRWSGTGETRRSSSLSGGSPTRVLSNNHLSPKLDSPRRSSISTDSPRMVRQRSRSSSTPGVTPPGSPHKQRSASNSPRSLRKPGSRQGSFDSSPRVELPTSFLASDGGDLVEVVRVR